MDPVGPYEQRAMKVEFQLEEALPSPYHLPDPLQKYKTENLSMKIDNII